MDPHSWSLHWDVLLAVAALVAVYAWSCRKWPGTVVQQVAFDVAVILLLAVYVTPLHTIALHRRQHDPATQLYVERRVAEGKSRREATRQLKRYLARHLYRLLQHQPMT